MLRRLLKNSKIKYRISKEGLPKIQEVVGLLKSAVERIRNIPGYLGFEEEDMRQMVEDFLKGIAQDLDIDKILAYFIQGYQIKNYYSLGLSQEEHDKFIASSEDIGSYFYVLPSQEERAALPEEREQQLLTIAPQLLRELGINSAAFYKGFLTYKPEEKVYDWVQLVAVGRTEETVKTKGGFTPEDNQKVEEAIRKRIEDYRALINMLIKEYGDFNWQQVVVRHNAGN